MAELKTSSAQQILLTDAASAGGHAVRKTEFDTAMGGKAATSHTHTSGQISDFTEAVQGVCVSWLADSNSVTWAAAGAQRAASVRLASSSGLVIGVGGLAVEFGSGAAQVAAGNHTHSQLHDILTKTNTDTVAVTLTGQLLSADVRLSSGGGLKVVSGQGLAVDIGSSAGQVAAGDHTHAQLHAAVTIQNTNTVTLGLSAQQISANVNLDPTPAAGFGGLSSTAAGLRVNLGTAANQAAAGNHSHAVASQVADGFLSASDKRKLDNYQTLHQLELPVLFHRSDAIAIGDYVGGKKRFGQSTQIRRVNVTAQAPVANVRLVLEVDGVAQSDTITIPAGTGEVTAALDLTNVFVPVDSYVRWKCDQGYASNGALENSASRIDLSMNVRAALGSLPEFQINCGGGAVSPYATDQFYDGGSASTTATVVTTGGVTNPAPASVYQSARTKYNGATNYPLTYAVVGLGRGVDYKVRCHFAEFYFNAAGEQVFDIEVQGSTTQTQANWDTYSQASGKFKAAVREFTLKADSNGQIRVRLLPKQGSGGLYHCGINGLEVIAA